MDSFGEAAARLCSAANVLLGWRPGEFWDSTPAELVLAVRAPAIASMRQTCERSMRSASAFRTR